VNALAALSSQGVREGRGQGVLPALFAWFIFMPEAEWAAAHPTVLLLPGRRDGVLGSLGHAELDHRLSFDLDGFTGLGIAPHTGLSLGLH
jgi:hypothetical protein